MGAGTLKLSSKSAPSLVVRGRWTRRRSAADAAANTTTAASAQLSPRTANQGNLQLGLYAQALLDELDDLAKTEEAEPKDRLCYPPEAVATARASLGVRREL